MKIFPPYNNNNNNNNNVVGSLELNSRDPPGPEIVGLQSKVMALKKGDEGSTYQATFQY